MPRLSKADALGSLIEKVTSPEVNLNPILVMATDGAVKHPGRDNHGMGTVFEELIRHSNQENLELEFPRGAGRKSVVLRYQINQRSGGIDVHRSYNDNLIREAINMTATRSEARR